ncbi:MAG: sigma-54 interaction domain-containing protein [Syntrophobacteraceae bacterium]
MPNSAISHGDLEKYWETVVSTIKDGVMIVDTTGCIVFANEAMESITGYKREELVGQQCSILNCDLFNMAREQGTDKWCVLLRTGNLDQRRCTIMKQDGSFVPVLKNASALRDSSGKIIGGVEILTDITEIVRKDKQLAEFRQRLRSEDSFHGIISASPAMLQVYKVIESAARSDAPVLIMGESGTGKGLVAKAIHELGDRNKEPFVCVNCAALTESLLENELFGHVKGAYTGAYKSQPGRFELAQGGDLFLDEIGDLTPSMQVKLLRVLEDKVIERVGDPRPIPVDVRIISATNRNLLNLLETGRFRKDFYFRINVIPINLPPLRERTIDIPLLVDHFFHKLRLKTSKLIKGIANSTMEILMNYSWPGNVRELKSAFDYIFATCDEQNIMPLHLPPDILKRENGSNGARAPNLSREELKKKQLTDALAKAKGNKSKAADILGISRVTVWNRMKRYGFTDL